MAQHSNYWFGTCPTRQKVTAGLVRNVDVLIIGGGIAGMSMLYQLATAGVSNTYLVEESSVGFHASGRSSGQLMFRGDKLFSQTAGGEEYLRFVFENNKRFVNGLRTASFDTDRRESGGLRLAIDEDELLLLKQEAEFIRKHVGLNCPIMSSDDIQTLLPDTGFVGGMFVPNEVTFNPYKVVNGLREMIERKGQRVLTGCQVTDVTKRDNGFDVSIRHKGIIRAKRLVYCTGAYTAELLPELADKMVSYRGQMVATDILPDAILQTLPQLSMSCHDCHEYWRLHGGRLLVGGMRHAVRGNQVGISNDGEVSPAVLDRLRGFVDVALPMTKDVKFTYTWSGIMCATPDHLPLVGALPDRPNEFILGGFNGYGYSHALQGGLIVKELMTKGISEQPGVDLFDPRRL